MKKAKKIRSMIVATIFLLLLSGNIFMFTEDIKMKNAIADQTCVPVVKPMKCSWEGAISYEDGTNTGNDFAIICKDEAVIEWCHGKLREGGLAKRHPGYYTCNEIPDFFYEP